MTSSRKIKTETQYGVCIIKNGEKEFKELDSLNEVNQWVTKYAVPDLFGVKEIQVIPVQRTQKIVIETSAWDILDI